MIDHSLLHQTIADADTLIGLRISRDYQVATACVKPYLIPLTQKELAGNVVSVCPVIGFPHGNSTMAIKAAEASAAVTAGADVTEIDMVVNISKILDGD